MSKHSYLFMYFSRLFRKILKKHSKCGKK